MYLFSVLGNLPLELKDLLIFEDFNVAFAYGAGHLYPLNHIRLMADPRVTAVEVPDSHGFISHP